MFPMTKSKKNVIKHNYSGDNATKFNIGLMYIYLNHSKGNPTVRHFVNKVFNLRKVPDERSGLPHTEIQEKRIRALFDEITEYFNFLPDTFEDELIQFPCETIKQGSGDCDDLSLLLASALLNCGFNPFFICASDRADKLLNHVFVGVDLGGQYVSLDLTIPFPEAGKEANVYTRKELMLDIDEYINLVKNVSYDENTKTESIIETPTLSFTKRDLVLLSGLNDNAGNPVLQPITQGEKFDPNYYYVTSEGQIVDPVNMSGFFDSIVDTATSIGESVVDTVKDAAKTVYNTGKNIVTGAVNTASGLGNFVAKIAKGGNVIDAAKNYASSVAGNLTSTLSPAASLIMGIADNAGKIASSAGKVVTDITSSLPVVNKLSGTISQITNLPSNLANSAKNVINNVTDVASGKKNIIKGVQDIAGSVDTMINDTLSAVEPVAGVLDAIIPGAGQAVKMANTYMNDGLSSFDVTSMINSAVSNGTLPSGSTEFISSILSGNDVTDAIKTMLPVNQQSLSDITGSSILSSIGKLAGGNVTKTIDNITSTVDTTINKLKNTVALEQKIKDIPVSTIQNIIKNPNILQSFSIPDEEKSLLNSRIDEVNLIKGIFEKKNVSDLMYKSANTDNLASMNNLRLNEINKMLVSYKNNKGVNHSLTENYLGLKDNYLKLLKAKNVLYDNILKEADLINYTGTTEEIDDDKVLYYGLSSSVKSAVEDYIKERKESKEINNISMMIDKHHDAMRALNKEIIALHNSIEANV